MNEAILTLCKQLRLAHVKEVFEQIQRSNELPPLARYSVKAYIEKAKQIDTDVAKELVEIFILLDRTIN